MLIDIEGIDGSGKETQANLLVTALRKKFPEREVLLLSFPDYSSIYGKEIADYLNEKSSGTPKQISMLYASDRLLRKKDMERVLSNNGIVICNRYVSSNIAFMTERCFDAIGIADFVCQNEYVTNGLPREDLVLWLDLPVKNAEKLVDCKDQREYTEKKRDKHEGNTQMLEHAQKVYRFLCMMNPTIWKRIPMMDGESLRSKSEIHEEIFNTVMHSNSIEKHFMV